MEYETFKNKVVTTLGEMLDDGMEVGTGEVMKLNGRKLDSIYIAKKGQEVFPTYYLNDLYEIYEDGEPIESIAYMLMAMDLRDTAAFFSGEEQVVNELMDFEKVKERILLKLINTEKNKELLADMPSVKYLDLSAVFFVVLAEDDFSYQAIVNNNLLETWGKKKKELLKLAAENTKRINQSAVMSLDDMLAAAIPSSDFPDDADGYEPSGAPILMISSRTRCCGAVYMMDTSLLAHCAENFDDDVIIIPSSIHEILVVPASEIDRENVERMVHEVNRCAVDPKEFLSDHSYIYSREKNKVTM